mmetsp:Transcript_9703/g.17050  ORF Transcript_9703/g.17050 Transcript_9703/m.17050 type:complete len:432 (+) Transcript_9703:34-1329(+)
MLQMMSKNAIFVLASLLFVQHGQVLCTPDQGSLNPVSQITRRTFAKFLLAHNHAAAYNPSFLRQPSPTFPQKWIGKCSALMCISDKDSKSSLEQASEEESQKTAIKHERRASSPRASVSLDSPVMEVAPTTLALQAMHFSLATAGLLDPARANEVVAGIWNAFDSMPLTHHCMFEASLAVAAFVLWIAFFESITYVVPGSEKFRLDGQPPVDALAGFGSDWHKTVVPAVTYLGSIALFHHFHLGTTLFGVKPAFHDPSFLRVAVEVSLGVFLYDLLFYPFHLSFHKLRSGTWRKMHRRHHRFAGEKCQAHNAVETVQNSYLDAGVQVFINICVQQISPWGYKHPLSRAFHNLMVTYLLCESHSGYDLPFMSHRLFPGIFGGAPRHELHHRNGNVHFHQFFCYLDNAFGFVDKRFRQRERLGPGQTSDAEDV